MGGSMASLQRCVELYLHKRRLFAYDRFPLPSSGPRAPPYNPLPQCLLLKVTQSKLGQSSQVKQKLKGRGPIAAETGPCSVSPLFSVLHLHFLSAPHLHPFYSLTSSPLRMGRISLRRSSVRTGKGREGMIER